MAPGPIALIASSYHPHVGGVEEHVRQVARELSRRGRRVAVWTVDRGEHLGVQVVDGVEVRYLPCPLPSSSVGGVLRFLAALPPATKAWWAAYRALRPAVLHVQCFGPNGIWAWALARLTRTPLVVSSHGETSGDDHNVFENSKLLSWSLRHAVRDAVMTTGCSHAVLADLRNRFGLHGGTVVPNGIDLDERLTPADVEVDGPVVLALGRVEHNKGFDLLLRAFARADLPAGTTLAIGGDGAELDPLRALAGELDIATRVSLLGRLDRDEVAGWLNAASLLVVPSRYEAFGIVILEAWRAGTPVLATSRGGPAEIITDKVDGMLVDPLDVEALSSAIASVINHPERATAVAAAATRTVAQYTWGETCLLYEAVYSE